MLSFLEEFADIFELFADQSIYEINTEQKKAIYEAAMQVTNNQILTNEEADTKTEELLNG
jgi:hypothetical protein